MSKKIKILYVDDEKINLQLFRINLSKKYTIVLAEDGIKGLEILAENKDIDVVISDMKMPIMNGVQFIKEAKEKHPEINYFILTGYEITEEIEEALRTGLILKYFRKPFDMSEVDSAINSIV